MTTLYASVGNEVVNYVSRFIDYTQFESGKSKRRLYESWGSPYLSSNADATMPIIYQNDTPHQEPSTAFLEDGSFLRMKTLRIGYDLNRVLKNKFNSLQVFRVLTCLLYKIFWTRPGNCTWRYKYGNRFRCMAYKKAVHIRTTGL